MTDNPQSARRFSIAMATYNGQKFLKEQLESIVRQTRQPDELVIFDDGSTDRTLELCRSFAQSAPFAVEIKQNETNLGFADNFLACAAACSGDWIFFCDQDDVWTPNKIAVVEGAIDRADDELALVFHKASVVSEDLSPLGHFLPDVPFEPYAPATTKPPFWFVGGCVMCFRADLLDLVPSDERPLDDHEHGRSSLARMAHDKWICYLASATGAILAVDEILLLYRRHRTATTAFPKQQRLSDRLPKMRFDPAPPATLQQFCHDVAVCLRSLGLAKAARKSAKDDALMYEELARLFGIRAKIYALPPLGDRIEAFRNLYFSRKASPRAARFFNSMRALKDLPALFRPK